MVNCNKEHNQLVITGKKKYGQPETNIFGFLAKVEKRWCFFVCWFVCLRFVINKQEKLEY